MPHQPTPGATAPGHATYFGLGRYATASGPRQLAAAYDPERQRWVLVDALEHTRAGELDARIVEDAIESPDEARALAADYLLRAASAHRPLVS